MNSKQKAILVLALSIILLSSIAAASAEDYSLTHAKIDMVIQDDGLVLVDEAITYHFYKTMNGVYRNIPINNYVMEDFAVDVDGAYYELEGNDDDSQIEAKVYLYNDEDKTEKIDPGTDVTVHYKYYMSDLLKVNGDNAVLDFYLLGDQWEVDLEELEANVQFPEKKELDYELVPSGSAEGKWSGDTLSITGENIKGGDGLELIVEIPLDEFTSGFSNAVHNGTDDDDNDIDNDNDDDNDDLKGLTKAKQI